MAKSSRLVPFMESHTNNAAQAVKAATGLARPARLGALWQL